MTGKCPGGYNRLKSNKNVCRGAERRRIKKRVEEKGNFVKLIRLAEKKIGYCRAGVFCMKNNGICIQTDDMQEILEVYKKEDVLILATKAAGFGRDAPMRRAGQPYKMKYKDMKTYGGEEYDFVHHYSSRPAR